jgi:putative endonuclease
MHDSRGKSRQYYVYVLASDTGVLYVGMTNDLLRRMHEHRTGIGGDFSKKYGTTRLIYYETTPDVHSSISREKQIKAWRRRKKLDLVRRLNPTFRDLGADLIDD